MIKNQIIEIAPVGSQLPLSPELQYNIRVRNDYNIPRGNPAYIWVGMKYADDSYSSLEMDKRYAQESYTVLDMAWGVKIGSTDLEVFARNLTDERAQLYFNDQDDIPRITTNRPKNIGVRVSYKF